MQVLLPLPGVSGSFYLKSAEIFIDTGWKNQTEHGTNMPQTDKSTVKNEHRIITLWPVHSGRYSSSFFIYPSIYLFVSVMHSNTHPEHPSKYTVKHPEYCRVKPLKFCLRFVLKNIVYLLCISHRNRNPVIFCILIWVCILIWEIQLKIFEFT